jgi:phytanoyl-CoA hydroxylase
MGTLLEHYRRDGWVKIPGVIASDKIDMLLAAYTRHLLPSRKKFYRQNTNRYERNHIDVHGHITNSFLDPHNYNRLPALRQAALDIFFDETLLVSLAATTGYAKHDLMQSMLFDKNAETTAHQDWWYLDSVPPGALAAAWIALEDIPAEAGRFYLVSGSHEAVVPQDLRALRHDAWLDLMRQYVQDHAASVEAPEMKKGDVIIWNSRTVHGALPTTDPKFSRKSLTAHFLPQGLAFGNLFVRKDWVQMVPYGPHRYFANQPEYSLRNDLEARIKTAIYDNPTLMRWARAAQRVLRRT